MHYILQEDGALDIEVGILKCVLDKHYKDVHSYSLSASSVCVENLNSRQLAEAIPVGNIGFVTKHLVEIFGLKTQLPIEIPHVLQTPEFLKRDYSIVNKHAVPIGRYLHIKHVDRFKSFTATMSLDEQTYTQIPDGTYAVSEVVGIVAEYRILVLCNKIIHIGHYAGNMLFQPDVRLLQRAVKAYSGMEHPKAYTLDVGVSYEGTFILEVHDFTAVGNYGYIQDKLPLLYDYGYEYRKQFSGFRSY